MTPYFRDYIIDTIGGKYSYQLGEKELNLLYAYMTNKDDSKTEDWISSNDIRRISKKEYLLYCRNKQIEKIVY